MLLTRGILSTGLFHAKCVQRGDESQSECDSSSSCSSDSSDDGFCPRTLVTSLSDGAELSSLAYPALGFGTLFKWRTQPLELCVKCVTEQVEWYRDRYCSGTQLRGGAARDADAVASLECWRLSELACAVDGLTQNVRGQGGTAPNPAVLSELGSAAELARSCIALRKGGLHLPKRKRKGLEPSEGPHGSLKGAELLKVMYTDPIYTDSDCSAHSGKEANHARCVTCSQSPTFVASSTLIARYKAL